MRRVVAGWPAIVIVALVATSCTGSANHPSGNGPGGENPAASASSSKDDLKTTVRYSGVYDEQLHYKIVGPVPSGIKEVARHVHFTFSESVSLTTPRRRLTNPIMGTSPISDSVDNKLTFSMSGSISETDTPSTPTNSCTATVSGVSGVGNWSQSNTPPPVEITVAALNPDGTKAKAYVINVAANVPGTGNATTGIIRARITSGNHATDGSNFCLQPGPNGGVLVKDPDCAKLWHPGPRETNPSEPPFLVLPLDTENYSNSYSCDYTDPISTPATSLTDGATGTDVITATGTLSVNASGCHTDTQSLGGTTVQLVSAVVPDDNTGGCPNIVWINDPDPKAQQPEYVGGRDDMQVQPGQLIKLKATIDNRDATSGAEWTLQDGTAQSYTLNSKTADDAADSAASVTPVTDKSQPTIQFFWISAGSSGSNQQPVQLKLNGKIVVAKFTIKAPSWGLDGVTPCQPAIDTKVDRPAGIPSFGLGTNDICPDHAGMQFAVHLDGDPGRVGVTQLVRFYVSHNGVACYGLNTSDYPLDNHDFQAVGTTRANFVDSPGYPLAGRTGTYAEDFFADDHVMFLSHVDGSFWVPLGQFGWNWHLQVHSDAKGHWTADKGAFVHTSTAANFSGKEPTWTALAQNGAPPC